MNQQQPRNNTKITPLSNIILLIGCCLLFFISLLLFSGTWQKDFIGKDEDIFREIPKHIDENIDFYKTQPHIPFTYITFILFQKISSITSFHYIINWLLHTLNTLLLFNLLARKSRTITSLILALLLSCLFLVHPLNIYSTSFLINRGGLLSSFFALILFALLYTRDEDTSAYLSVMFYSIILIILSVFSHFIGIVMIIPVLYYSYLYKSKNESIQHTIVYSGVILFGVLFSTFIFFALYNYNYHRDLFEATLPFNYFNTISGFFILTLFPTSFFPLQYFGIESFLSIPITVMILCFLFILGFYFYRNSKTMPFLSCLVLVLSVIIYPVFQRVDLSMCNSSYFLILSSVILCFFVFQNIFEEKKIISYFTTIFLIIILFALTLFSFQLTYELRDPERLWLACAGNYTSNPETWKYLARILTKKTHKEIPKKDMYIDKAGQAWNALLELQPDNTEALRGISLLCLENNRYDDARQYIKRAISLNPFEKENIRQQIKIIESEIKAGNNNPDDLIHIYNSYMHLYLIEKNLNQKEKLNFLKIAKGLSNYEQAWEVLQQDSDMLDDKTKEDLLKQYEKLKILFNNIPVPLSKSGDSFTPPYLMIVDYYEQKGLLSLAKAWLSAGFQKEQNNKDFLIKLGKIYGKLDKSTEFIERWGNFLGDDNQLWEKLVRECVINSNFSSAQNYADKISYSISKRYMFLCNIAIENGYQEQAKLWLEKAKESNPTSEEIQEINELINKIQK